MVSVTTVNGNPQLGNVRIVGADGHQRASDQDLDGKPNDAQGAISKMYRLASNDGLVRSRSKPIAACGLVRSFALWLGVVITFAAGGSHGADKPIPEPQDYHYELVMSEQDSLCKPLAGIYNRLLHQLMKNFAPPFTEFRWNDFEIDDPKSFEEIGIAFPPQIDSPEYPRPYFGTLYLADIYNEGTPRIVVVGMSHEGTNFVSRITVLKTGQKYREIRGPELNGLGRPVVKIDPEVIDTERYIPMLLSGQYPLKKWSGFEQRYQQFIKEGKPPSKADLVPLIGNTTNVVFIFDTTTYILSNMYENMNGVARVGTTENGYKVEMGNSVVVVSRVRAGVLDDICYIALAPTPITNAIVGGK